MHRIVKISATALVAASLTAGGAFAQSANANANSGSVSGSSSGSNSNVSINSKSYRTTGAAFAPGLAVGGFSCQGSVSAGAGGAGWGVAFGTTVMDRDCNTRENAKVAAAAFGVGVGRRVLCRISDIKEAAGSACGGNEVASLPSKGGVRGYAPRVQPVSADYGWGQRSK